MASVTSWTGRTACALQAALRMSNELFAEHLGIAVRTVAAWHQKPTLTPRSEIQQLLDTALEQAPQPVKIRFSENVASFADPLVGTPGPVAAPVLQTPGNDVILLSEMLKGVTVLDPSAEQAWRQRACRSAEVVELAFDVRLDIQDNGWARLSFRRELANLSDRPMSRLRDQLWFEHTQGPLKVAPISSDTHRVAINRTHETANSVVFFCLISPPIRPGESGVVGYTCEGCRFVEDHYWRQVIARHTRRFSISLHHQGAAHLVNCSATEEDLDGAENSIADMEWAERDGAVDVTAMRHHLRPSEAITLRWEVDNVAPR